MYQNDETKIKKVNLIAKICLVALVIVLIIKLLTMMGTSSIDHKNSFEKNLDKLVIFSNEYLKDLISKDELNLEIGKSQKIYLSNIKDTKSLYKEEDKCFLDESYILITKLDDEYQIKSFLSCKDQNDYKTTYIKVNIKEEEIKPTVTTTTTTTSSIIKTTTKKVVTPKKKKYKISLNTNGGSYIEPIMVSEGEKIKKIEITVRTGYTFVGWYLNGEEFDLNSIINKDIVLVARWIKNN